MAQNGHEIESNLSLEEKMIKLITHWIKHNEDHADSYMNWAQKAKQNHLIQAGAFLAEASAMTREISGKFQKAIQSIKGCSTASVDEE